MSQPLCPRPVLPVQRSWPLHTVSAGRAIEQAAAAALPPHTLMTRAGDAVAHLAFAVAPHARSIEVWCGAGNNGGDGFVAARLLQSWGKAVRVIVVGDPARRPADAAHAWQQAQDAGVPMTAALPERVQADLAIDGLLGVGVQRALDGPFAAAVERLNVGSAPVVAVDLPSGLDADTGRVLGVAVHAAHTLALLTLKPGLFTAQGRDCAGRVWFDDLSVQGDDKSLELAGPEGARMLSTARRHAQHKGSFGDAVVVGGVAGMVGAAVLAARAALAAGAGRVYLGLLANSEQGWVDPVHPEVMARTTAQLLAPSMLEGATVVCGCGGGDALQQVLPPLLHRARRLVLDADALNTIAIDAGLHKALRARAARGLATVLTPHPLEAARLLGSQTPDVQADRLHAARALADATLSTVLLKGSGTIIATPGCLASINATGDARLGTAGSGDVLAGWLGGWWSAHADAASPHAVAQAAAWLHGAALAHGPLTGPLRASLLIEAMVLARDALRGQATPP